MIKRKIGIVLLAVTVLFAIVACGSQPVVDSEQEQPAKTEAEPEKQKAKETVAVKEDKPAESKKPETSEAPPEKTVETEQKEETAEKPPVEKQPTEAAFEVSEEVYEQTFDDIQAIIEELNQTIRSKDYETWLTYLTEEYVAESSKQSYLDRWHKDPRLIEKKIVLRTLRDYFDHVVVPTRFGVKLDEIEFLDDTRLYAYTVFKGRKYLLYYLVKPENSWKIDFY